MNSKIGFEELDKGFPEATTAIEKAWRLTRVHASPTEKAKLTKKRKFYLKFIEAHPDSVARLLALLEYEDK